MTVTEAVLGLVVLYLIFAPLKYDPAIRLKEWNENRRRPR